MRTFLIIVFIAVCGSAFAHKDRIEQPQTLTVTFKTGESVTSTISNEVVTAMSVRIGKKTYTVPQAECAKFRDIRFETTKLLWNGSYKTSATADYFYLQFRMGPESERTFGELPEVEVMFRGGNFSHISMTKKTADDTWETLPLREK